MTQKQFHSEYLPLAADLYRVAFYILESRAEAEDAVQDTYLKLWELRDSLEQVRSPKAYSVTLLRNICLDRLRRAQKMDTGEQAVQFAAALPQDENLDAKGRLGRVLEAIHTLPDGQRKVLLMRTVQGLSYEEISQITGMTNLSLRVLLSQARKKLKLIK